MSTHLRTQWRTAARRRVAKGTCWECGAPTKTVVIDGIEYTDKQCKRCREKELSEPFPLYRGLLLKGVRDPRDLADIARQALQRENVGIHWTWEFASAGSFAMLGQSYRPVGEIPVVLEAEVTLYRLDDVEMYQDEAQRYDPDVYKDHMFSENEHAIRPGTQLPLKAVWVFDDALREGEWTSKWPEFERGMQTNRRLTFHGEWVRLPMHSTVTAAQGTDLRDGEVTYQERAALYENPYWEPGRSDITRRVVDLDLPVALLRDPSWVDIVRNRQDWFKPTFEDTKASIAADGLLNGIEVAVEQNGSLTILDGTHRIFAVHELGWETIPLDELRYFGGSERYWLWDHASPTPEGFEPEVMW